MSDHPDCTEKCATMPQCAVCGRPKAPKGRSLPIDAATGYCGHDCSGYYVGPQSGHLWREEWHDEVERRAAEASDEAEAHDREAQQREDHDADLYEKAQLDKLDAQKNGDR